MTSPRHRLLPVLFLMMLWSLLLGTGTALAASEREYILGPGDVIKISVFEHPELATEVRVSETGRIRFPLVGEVPVGGLSTSQTESALVSALVGGGFLKKPQVNILLTVYRSQQIDILGHVGRPGRFPIDQHPARLSDFLAQAGGILPSGADVVRIVRSVSGKPQLLEINHLEMFDEGKLDRDLAVQGGDVIYVPRAPYYYAYGEIQRPGQFRVEARMTVMQAMAVAGGVTPRGTLRNMQVTRRDQQGNLRTFTPSLADYVQSDDVFYIKESLF